MLLNDYRLPNHDLRISIATRFDSADMSGETSSTSDSHTGIKAKVISVSFTIRFVDEALLSELYSTAEAVDDNGDLVVYRITNKSANAANILQAKFHGQLNVVEHRSLFSWQVRLQLKEHLSVPEKKEQRTTATTETTTDTTTTDTATGGVIDTQTEDVTLTGFEKILQTIDNGLA